MWEINVADQTWSFFLSVILGVIFCVLYDFLRACRRVLKPSNTAVFFQDIFYFLIAGVLTFCLLLITTSGEVRGFVFVSIVLGFTLCRFTLSVVLLKILVMLLSGLVRIFRYLKLKITGFFGIVFKKVMSLAQKAAKYLKNVGFYIKKLLHKNTDIVYNDCDLSQQE